MHQSLGIADEPAPVLTESELLTSISTKVVGMLVAGLVTDD
ncbi:MAG TPA: hypothetical protein VD837_05075 [Terriglobales bacterium]|nr:hypothetical protein [Terriglobales bacterium]